jgi:hypothetical protein
MGSESGRGPMRTLSEGREAEGVGGPLLPMKFDQSLLHNTCTCYVCGCARCARKGAAPASPPTRRFADRSPRSRDHAWARCVYAGLMTRYLGRPEPLPFVDEEDLHSLACDFGAGYFASAEIYQWHVKTLAKEGRKPVDRKTFGLALKEGGWQSSVRRIDGTPTRCWLITRSAERKAIEFYRVKAES